MVRFLRTVFRHALPLHGLPRAVLLSRLRTGIGAALRPERVAAVAGAWNRIARSLRDTKSFGMAKTIGMAKTFGIAKSAGISSALERAKAIGKARWVTRQPEVADSPRTVAASPEPAPEPPPAPDTAPAGTQARPPNSMQTFVDLIAKAVNPSMSRDERERVYGIVRQAVLRLHDGRAPLTADPQVALQLHLVEETIRDLEADIARHNVMERMRLATEAQAAEITASPDKDD